LSRQSIDAPFAVGMQSVAQENKHTLLDWIDPQDRAGKASMAKRAW